MDAIHDEWTRKVLNIGIDPAEQLTLTSYRSIG